MGVSGAGKTTVGRILADQLGWQFHDGDDLHPDANKQKMHRGVPLTDDDRWPWLRRVRGLIDQCLRDRVDAVIACSALRQSYRDLLIDDPEKVKLVYLRGSQAEIAIRLAKRTHRFMNPELLKSQFDTLEEPRDACIVDISATPEAIVAAIRSQLRL